MSDFDTFENNKGIRSSVYRGTPALAIYGPARCAVDEGRNLVYPETVTRDASTNENAQTHSIFIEPRAGGSTYRPLLDDRVLVTGSTDAALDGFYVVVRYSLPTTGFGGIMDYTELKVRYLGAKKATDDQSEDDNSDTLLLGG